LLRSQQLKKTNIQRKRDVLLTILG